MKQVAVTAGENELLHALIGGEIKSGFNFGQEDDAIDIQRVLIDLYDRFDNFNPPDNLTKSNEDKKNPPPRVYKTPRRSSQGDMQEIE